MTEVLTRPMVADHCGICRAVIGERNPDELLDYERFCAGCTDLPQTWGPSARRRILRGANAPDPEDVDDLDEDDMEPAHWSCPNCAATEARLVRRHDVVSCSGCSTDDSPYFHVSDYDSETTVECVGCGRSVRDWEES